VQKLPPANYLKPTDAEKKKVRDFIVNNDDPGMDPLTEMVVQLAKDLISSHPETTLPDENTQLPAIIYGQKPFKKGFLARASWSNQGVSIRKFEFPDGN